MIRLYEPKSNVYKLPEEVNNLFEERKWVYLKALEATIAEYMCESDWVIARVYDINAGKEINVIAMKNNFMPDPYWYIPEK